MMRNKEKIFFKKKKNGFTLIEILIVVAIIGMLSAIVFIGLRGKEDDFTIQRSAHKLDLDIGRAKELTMRAEDFGAVPSRGGFGVHFEINDNYYILFADVNENRIFDAMELYEKIELEQGVTITSLSQNPLTIVFIPPDPTVRISGGLTSATITLGINSLIEAVNVNNAGLIYVR